jgi:hypothetical protein
MWQAHELDPRSRALARYLRRSAGLFSLSADHTSSTGIAVAGMALLDAAIIAESIPAGDPRLTVLSEAGLFESQPHGEASFVETAEVLAAIRRPLVSGPEDGPTIIAKLVAVATALNSPGSDGP